MHAYIHTYTHRVDEDIAHATTTEVQNYRKRKKEKKKIENRKQIDGTTGGQQMRLLPL
jgi:hypothetical protein